jgi:cation-transporting ATPase E
MTAQESPRRSPLDGLTAAEVQQRTLAGQTNEDRSRPSRSVGDIIRSNVFTFFNGLLLVLLVAILIFGSPRDALFGFVLVFNVAIGITQELSAKRTLDRVSLLAAPRVRAVRDAAVTEVPMEAVVLDDVLELGPGDQIVADGEVLSSSGLEVDESLLTGESHPVEKAVGDRLLSGSFCAAGAGRMRATSVGAESYARELAAQAKAHRTVSSELRRGTDRILKTITLVMVPMAVLLIATRWPMTHDLHALVPETVAALVGMIPQGLVLLTSVAFVVSVTKLARRGALVEQLPAVEVLARVDVLCVDKTGTLTDSALELQLVETVPVPGGDDALARTAFGAIAALEPEHARNATARALAAAFPAPDAWAPTGTAAFSSARKWSGADFGDRGAWVVGAPDVLLVAGDPVRVRASELAAEGARVILLARADALPEADGAPLGLRPEALAILGERIRTDAAETLAYFREQGVTVKVISGDAPETAAWVARRCGLDLLGDPIDAATLPEDVAALAEVLETHTVFGRVRPDQKRAMVAALQHRGHVVAMTGDGVNDTLALKAADLGIAMGSGTPAAKAVALLVLLDSRFAALPGVVAEGRRVIANIERVANLFVTKTVYAALLALAAAVLAISYPLLPRHFTLVDALTIGIPGFFLALAPMAPRYRPGYLGRVLRFTAVTGVAAGAATLGAYAWALRVAGGTPSLGVADARAVAVTVLVLVGLWVLGVLSRPWTPGRIALLVGMAASFAVVLLTPVARDFFALPFVPVGARLAVAVATMGGVAAIEIGLRLTRWRSTVLE